MNKSSQPTMSAWQKQLLAELRVLAAGAPHELRVLESAKLGTDGEAMLRISLRTEGISGGPGGLPLRNEEQFIVRIKPALFYPPSVDVDHTRFLGYPHVLQGQRLCVYLDPSREWRPALGMAGFLNRLWEWLTDAASGRFNPSTAMYHAVGGVLHHADGTPTIVVREPGPSRRMQTSRLISRSPHRLDLTYASSGAGLHAPVMMLSSDMPFGAASTFQQMLTLLDDPRLDRASGRQPQVAPQSPAFLTGLLASASRNPDGSQQYFILAVLHPSGGPRHLLGGRLPASTSNALRRIAKAQGTTATIDPATIKADIPIEWCNMSDERGEVTTRRDDNRPVNGYQGKTVHVWGCGGLGSWMAEFVARAGASTIVLCDPGTITGGLLVRQNYVESDIGKPKAEALASRLRAIRDDLTVVVAGGSLPDDPNSFLTADLIIDATVSNGITSCLDALMAIPGRTALIAQVATDARTGTLGIVHLTEPSSTQTPSELDQISGQVVLGDSSLELYHPLWQEAADGDELIPTRGCSVPTFHGSAADLVAVAATLTSLIGSHIQLSSLHSGTHLVALPHAAQGPRHRFIPAPITRAGSN